MPVFIFIGYYLIFLHPHFQKLSENKYSNLSTLGFVLFDEDEEYADRVIDCFADENEWMVKEYDEKKGYVNRNCILTIGDSFSEERVGSYSNSLAHTLDTCIVANLKNPYPYPNPFIKYWEFFVNETELPSVIIVESVERYLINRLLELDFDKKEFVISSGVEKGKTTELERLKKRTSDYYKNLLKRKIKRPVRHVKLAKELFSCKGSESEFYFYDEEITITNTLEEIEIASQKIDSLFLFAEERNITLIILVAADPYDVYQSYILDNPYSSKIVLDELTTRIASTNYIDTKQLLLPYLEQGVKDIYWCTDSHWSPIGATIVAEEIARRMDSLGVFKK